jgi:hypothetical protein
MKRYSGRTFSPADIECINQLIKDNPNLLRAALSREVCQALFWINPQGKLKEMSCRVAMIRMQEDGLITLPTPRNKNPSAYNKKIVYTDNTAMQPVCSTPAGQLKPITFSLISNRKQASLWNEYVDRYHYLGHKTLPGAQLRYFIYSGEQLIACLGFGAAAWKTAGRDQFIGWDPLQREKNLHLVVNNARFLILPWIQSRNLASKILSLSAKQLMLDWPEKYNYKPVLLETFVELPRFTGACYKAANWLHVGTTKGRGRNDRFSECKLFKKDIFLFPLDKDFKLKLCL